MNPQSIEAIVVAIVILVCGFLFRRYLYKRGLEEKKVRWMGTAFIAIALAIYVILRLWVI